MDAYAAQAIDLIVDGVPSEEVCRTLGFCPKKQTPELGDGCAICEIVFTELYRRLKSNTTAELIEQYLEAVCDWIPATYQPQVGSSEPSISLSLSLELMLISNVHNCVVV